jgi:hypothetical protein
MGMTPVLAAVDRVQSQAQEDRREDEQEIGHGPISVHRPSCVVTHSTGLD